MDHALIIYVVITLIGIYGTALFWYERYRNSGYKIGNVFTAIHLVNVGLIIIGAINVAARISTLNNTLYIHYQWYWPLRWYPLIIAVAYLNLHLTLKLLGYTDEP